MNHDSRPINLDLTTFRFPLAALASITHRVAGGVLFVGVGFGLYALELSLASPASFESLQSTLSGAPAKLITWALLAALLYHLVAGFKHLLMDFGIGETIEGGKRLAQLVILVAGTLILGSGYWLFN